MNLKPLVAALALVVVSSSFASTLFETGFERPYTPGGIDGQQGWAYFSDPAGNSASVTDNRAFAGTNSLFVTALPLGYSDAIRPLGYTPSASAEKVVQIDTMVFVEPSGTDIDDEGLVGIDLYDGTNALAASLGLGTATGTVFVYDWASDLYLYDPLAPTISLSAWHRITVALDFSGGGAPEYLVGIDGVFQNLTAAGLTTGFTATSTLGDADLVALGSDTFGANACFDDFSVQAVPEPGSLVALGAGVLALGLRRRR